MPRRHDGHTLDGDNVSPLAGDSSKSDEPDDFDAGATHLGTSNDSAPMRRERQRNEPDDDFDAGATHLGTSNDLAPARRLQRKRRTRR
jgi:hypothetical protein